jgi:hypothetical protein
MNGLDVRIEPVNLVLKHCRIHTAQVSLGSFQCCVNVTNESARGGTFLLFSAIPEADEEAATSGRVTVSLLSELQGVVGTGHSDVIKLQQSVDGGVVQNNLTRTFTLRGGLDTVIALQHKTEGKPDIELGSMRVTIRLYSLALVKECVHTCQSPETEKERYEVVDHRPVWSLPIIDVLRCNLPMVFILSAV